MSLQFWRNLGYPLCLVGLWFHTPALEDGYDLKFIVAFVAFWGGVLLLAATLFFDWVDHSDSNRKK